MEYCPDFNQEAFLTPSLTRPGEGRISFLDILFGLLLPMVVELLQ